MQDFLDFYQFGGLFNHVVSLFALAAVASLVLYAARRPGTAASLLHLGERFIALGVAAGVLGTLFNVMEMSAALEHVSEAQFLQASNRGMSLVPIPLVWSLLCAIPIWLATTCLRHRAPAVA